MQILSLPVYDDDPSWLDAWAFVHVLADYIEVCDRVDVDEQTVYIEEQDFIGWLYYIPGQDDET